MKISRYIAIIRTITVALDLGLAAWALSLGVSWLTIATALVFVLTASMPFWPPRVVPDPGRDVGG